MKRGITDTPVIWHKTLIITDASQMLFIIPGEADHHIASPSSVLRLALKPELKCYD